MPKKIGFIDYFIDEWHANNYPQMIKDSALGDHFEVALAWEQITPEGKTPLAAWCEQHGVRQAKSLEQVVEECDVLLVLSPDNGEKHEELSDLPLRSGKPTYIDKPIALKFDEARRMYDKARQHGTPVFSSSALRFGSALQDALAGPLAEAPVHFALTTGPGLFPIYGVHQLEMLVAIMGPGVKRVMHTGNAQVAHLTLDYGDGRRAAMSNVPGLPFTAGAYWGGANEGDKAVHLAQMNDFFPRFIDAMLGFFDTGESPVDPAQTLEIAALIETGIKALDRPDEWVKVG